jgi:glucose-6-phosphate 1-epimerase
MPVPTSTKLTSPEFTDWRHEIAPGGLPVLRLAEGDLHAEIALMGAHLISFRNTAVERSMFWAAGAAAVAGHAFRGGVPLVFPWFGGHADRADFPNHGFARNLLWSVAEEFRDGNGYGIALELTDSPITRVMWPHAFRARLETVVSGAGVAQRLLVRNDDKSTMRFECGLHPYFAVGDVRNVSVEGLDGESFIDKTSGTLDRQVQHGALRFTRPVDSVYLGATAPCRILEPGKPTLRIEKSGSRTTVVWNPGSKTPDTVPPSPFVCVEPMNCFEHAIELPPGAEHILTARYVWES